MAGSRIKGITIEIDGNTTKLQKSLSAVDKQLRETQSTLRDVDKLLKLDPKNTELLQQKQKALGDAINLTKTRLQQLKDAQSQVAQGTPAWDALQREIIATEQDLKSLEKQSKDFGSVFAQQVAAAGQSMKELGGKITEAGQAFAPISGAAAGLVVTLGGLGYKAVTTADDLNTLSKQTGLTTETLQKMIYASDLVDVSVEDITGAVTKMKKAMGGSPDAFDNLGVSVTNADGSMRSAENVFFDTLAALSQIENEVERDQAAYDIFGKSADQLAGIVDDGGESLKAYGVEAENLGLILSDDTLSSLNEVNDAVDKGKAQLDAATTQLGATVAESLLPLVEPLSAGIQKITESLQSLSPEAVQMIAVIAGIIAVVAPLLMTIGGVINAIGTIMVMAPALGAAFTALTGPIGAVVTAVVLLAIGIATHWDEIKAVTLAMIEAVKAKWEEFKAKISEVWNNVKTTVSNAINNVKSRVDAMKTSISNAASNILNVVKSKFNAVKTAITQPIETAKTLVQNAINRIKGIFSGANFSLPHIKLPHFSISGSFSLNPPSIPHISVDWYRKAYDNPYLFTAPTVMQTPNGYKGFGDGGGSGEIVYGRDQLMRDISEAAQGNVTINVYASQGMDINRLAGKIEQKLVQWQRQKGAAYGGT